MGYGLKLKKPSYAKDTEIHVIESIPEILLRLDDRCTPAVGEGTHVLAGQLLADSPSDSTPLYSSVSGNVLGTVVIDGKQYIKIENDGKYDRAPSPVPTDMRLSQMSTDDMVERIRMCAIPLWKTLSGHEKLHRLVLDCLDRDNYCADVKCEIHHSAHEIIGGVKILLKLLSLDNCEIVIEKGNSQRVNDLLEYIGESTLFGLTETDGIYRSGERADIICSLLSLGELPYDQICVLDVHTAAAVYRAFSSGDPYIRRLISVGGTDCIQGGCYDLPLGTPLKAIEKATAKATTDGEATPSEVKLCICNGAMTGSLTDTAQAFVEDDTHSLLFMPEDELFSQTGGCIGCGKCDRACSDRLSPSLFIRSCENSFDLALKTSGMDRCTACGACSCVCPARIPIHEVAKGNTRLPRPDMKYKKRRITSAPFIRQSDTTRSMNLDLIFALCALAGWAVCKFGIRALIVCAISVLCAVGSDIIFNILTKSSVRSVLDLGSAVCGLSCALVMSVNTPLYAVALASFFAIMVVRGIFGGSGRNVIHSVFCARILVSMFWHESFVYGERNYTMFDHLLGNTDGALGEVSFILLIACALYLVYRRVILILPSAVALSVFSFVSFMSAPASFDALDFCVVTTVSTAITYVCVFCSSEHSTIPSSTAGRAAWGVLCGSVAAVITRYTSYDGAYAAAVLASAVTVPMFRLLGCSGMRVLPQSPEADADDEPAEKAEKAEERQEADTEVENKSQAESNFTSDKESTKEIIDTIDDGEFNIEVDKMIDAISAEIGLSE